MVMFQIQGQNCLRCLIALLLWGVAAWAWAVDYQGDYQVDIIAPPGLKQLLAQNLDLVRWRGNERLDQAQWWRVYQALPEQVAALVATEGYFSAKVVATLDQSKTPWLVRLELEPGEAVRVGQVDLQLPGFTDDVAPDRAQLRADWPLRTGMIFRQAQWEQAKRGLLRQASLLRYPLAQLSDSHADVDLETGQVHLTVVLQSGPAVQFGGLKIEGLQRYSESVVRNLNPIQPGSVYSEAALLEFQTRLQDVRYFKSVSVSTDLSAAASTDLSAAASTAVGADLGLGGGAPLITPVLVSVIEQRRKKVDLGLGYSTNTGNRLQAAYSNLDWLGLASDLQLNTALLLETRKQSLHAEWVLPTSSRGDTDSLSSAFDRSDLNGEVTRTGTLAAKRSWGNASLQRSLTLEFQNEQKTINGQGKSISRSLPLSFQFTRRHFDSLLFPTRGNAFNLQIGGTPVRLLSDEPFFRGSLKYLQYWPLTRQSNLLTRVELGGLFSRHKTGIPQSYLFRAGGDQSVRGYGLAQLGEKQGDAVVGARYLTTASVEYQYWPQGRQWGGAVFYDAGNAKDNVKELTLKAGYGAGLRWRSPVGPINVDLAYGRAIHKYRLHFSLGLTF